MGMGDLIKAGKEAVEKFQSTVTKKKSKDTLPSQRKGAGASRAEDEQLAKLEEEENEKKSQVDKVSVGAISGDASRWGKKGLK
jgi:hypothetical protein